jgi:hypothetical protein
MSFSQEQLLRVGMNGLNFRSVVLTAISVKNIPIGLRGKAKVNQVWVGLTMSADEDASERPEAYLETLLNYFGTTFQGKVPFKSGSGSL